MEMTGRRSASGTQPTTAAIHGRGEMLQQFAATLAEVFRTRPAARLLRVDKVIASGRAESTKEKTEDLPVAARKI